MVRREHVRSEGMHEYIDILNDDVINLATPCNNDAITSQTVTQPSQLMTELSHSDVTRRLRSRPPAKPAVKRINDVMKVEVLTVPQGQGMASRGDGYLMMQRQKEPLNNSGLSDLFSYFPFYSQLQARSQEKCRGGSFSFKMEQLPPKILMTFFGHNNVRQSISKSLIIIC